MKHLIVTFTLMLSLISVSSFANNEKNNADAEQTVSATVLKSFQDGFKNAAEVSWSIADQYSKASFVMNGQYISAFYNHQGELLAVARNVSSLQLPLSLQTGLKQRSGDLWISDLIEVSNDSGISYYITLENADTKVVLKSVDSDWTTFQKQRKS